MKKIIAFISVFALAAVFAGPTFGSYGSVACQPVYGGGQTCVTTDNVSIDKKVLNPKVKGKGGAELFVDNLSLNDPKYVPSQNVKFQLSVTNTGDSVLEEVQVSDVFPSEISFVSGNGFYDQASRTLTFNVFNLNPDETRTFILVGRVVDAGKLPSGQGMVCTVNQAIAQTNGKESKDNSQFCIEKSTTKGGLPVMSAPKVTQTPATGPELLPLLGLIPAALGGAFLRRKSK